MSIHRRALIGGIILTPAVLSACGSDGDAGTAAAAYSEPTSEPAEREFADYLEQRTAGGAFSGAVLVAVGDRPAGVTRAGYGLADRSRRLPVRTTTRFCVASMGKMFTAVALAQLAERGTVSFGATVGRYLPGFPAAIADGVTIHQLLTHTSGMGDVLRRAPGVEPPATLPAMLAEIARQPLAFTPGSRFSYSNSGFIVLGGIIERISGQKYADQVTRHVFGPAGMTDTAIRAYRPSEVPGMAHGYARLDTAAPAAAATPTAAGGPAGPGPGPGPGPAPGHGPGGAPTSASAAGWRDVSAELQVANPSGGAYSTVDDMRAFARALLGYRLLTRTMTTTVLTGKVDTGRPGPFPERYGYGFSDQTANGVRIVGHNGGTPGYEGQLDMYPDRGRIVVVLTNADGVLVPAIQRSETLYTA
jgi:CubicO group peptidase (beta-lactamase class C family)